MNIKITAKNAFTKKMELEMLTQANEGENMDNIHKILSKVFPDCFVNIDMGEYGFIAGQPYNMAKDEILQAAGLMEWDDYMAKWYPTIKNS